MLCFSTQFDNQRVTLYHSSVFCERSVMTLAASFFNLLAWLVEVSANLFMLALFLRAISSWVSADPGNPLYRFLIRVTEPVLAPIRRALPVQAGGFDFSPVAAFAGVWALSSIATGLLRGLASTH
jgi:YggT family protein